MKCNLYNVWSLNTLYSIKYIENSSLCLVNQKSQMLWKTGFCYSSVHNINVFLFFIHIKNPTRCNSVSEFYFIFTWSSTCFGWHTAHHQEPKTALAASGFAYIEGCWPYSCWMLSASSNYTANNPPCMQNQRLLVQFRLLMMGGVSPKTSWVSYK